MNNRDQKTPSGNERNRRPRVIIACVVVALLVAVLIAAIVGTTVGA